VFHEFHPMGGVIPKNLFSIDFSLMQLSYAPSIS